MAESSRKKTWFVESVQPADGRGGVSVNGRGEGEPQVRAMGSAQDEPSGPSAGQPSSTEATAIVDFLQPQSQPQPGEAVGTIIGRYKLLQNLGEGGWGEVYVAEQIEPVRRRVALKVIKLGMDTKAVVARFEAERQALALMDHPNIAKVLDAGTTERGRPYFVMELVRGIKITDYCNQHRLPIRERLKLFIRVCQAIQHAHQKGIVHRDIKPSNILVTLHDGAPVPKVIDFGIAKATDTRLANVTVFTQMNQFIGTPAYMSPEQADLNGLDIDTRSDIYSLGVLLYELLTGHTPFDSQELAEAGLDRMRQTIREKEPTRPSKRLRPKLSSGETPQPHTSNPALLASDLDWIAMKCLEKDRTRRYETAIGLAIDIQRHLDHEPVVARPPSAGYRLQKAFRRNRLGFAAGGAVALALTLGLVGSTWQAVVARRAQAEAENARGEAQEKSRIADRQKNLADESARAARAEQEKTRRALARASIALAEAAYREQDSQTVQEALAAVPEDLRDTTWHYLKAHADVTLATIDLFTIGAAAHPALPGVFAVAERSSGRIVLVQAQSGNQVLDISLSAHQRRYQYYRGLAFSPDGRHLAAGGLDKAGIALYDLRTGGLVREWASPETDLLEYSPDGRRLLQCSSIDGEVCLWNAADGQLVWKLTSAARAVFHPDGKELLAMRGPDLVVLEAATGHVVRTLGRYAARVWAMAVHPDGRRVFTGDWNGNVRAVDMRDGQVIFERPAHDHFIRFLALTPDGQRFVTAATGSGHRRFIRVWDAQTGAPLQSILGGRGQIESLKIHPLTDDLLIAGPQTKTWALSGEKPAWTLPRGSTAAFFGSDDSCLGFTREAGVGFYKLAAGEAKAAWRRDEPANWLLESSADGLVAAAVRSENLVSHIHLLRAAGGVVEETRVIPIDWAVGFARLSPSGDRVMTFVPGGTSSGAFDTDTGERLPRLDHSGGIIHINDVAWLNEDRVVGAVTTHALRGAPRSEEGLALWDARSGQRLKTTPGPTIIHCVAASPDGRRFAEAGEDKLVRIRDAVSLEIQAEFRAHDGNITALAWHPAQPIVATASADLTIKLWHLPSGRCQAEIRGPLKPVTMLRFSPGGRRLISAGADNIRVWEPKAR